LTGSDRAGTEHPSEKARAAAASSVFFVLAPGIVAGLVPWLISGWSAEQPLGHWAPLRALGGAIVIAGAAVLIHAFARFVAEGLGTPAPIAPTSRLVVGGVYRYVRNPMYLAVTAAILGQALLLWEPAVAVYGVGVLAAVAAFVRLYEEPTLHEQFGAEYDAYRRAVPAWLPRRRPWTPPDGDATGPA
jgi:protein-S-isoprenylcysteine O-methyltransferase Ste14